MKIVFLTTADPIYLPDFFERVLAARAGDTQAVYVVAPLYKGQSTAAAVGRQLRTFGVRGVLTLGRRVVAARLRRNSIAAVCARHRVACERAQDVNAPSFLATLRELAPDVIVSVSCPQIFREELIGLPPKGLLNVHGAALPQYRGVMPSFWMLANGERRAGVSVYFVDERIDAGDLCGQALFDIAPDDSLDSFLRRSKAIAASLLLEVLDAVERDAAERRPLDLSQGSYYSWPDRGAVRRFRAAGHRL